MGSAISKGQRLRKLGFDAVACLVSLALVAAFVPALASSTAYAADDDSSDAEITGAGSYTATIEDDDEYYAYLYFASDVTGYYSVSASSGSCTYLSVQQYYYDEEWDEYWWSSVGSCYSDSNAQLSVFLAAGESYRVVVGVYDDDEGDIVSGAADIAVTVEQRQIDVSAMTLGTEYDVEIATAGDYAFFSYTPSESGTYRFYTLGNYDTYAYLCDSDWVLLDSDDDGMEDGYGNAVVEYELQAGSTYYVAFRLYSASETGSFTVQVAQPVDLSGATVELSADTFEFTGNEVCPDITVTLDGTELTSGSDYSVSYTSNCLPGTVTLTVTGIGAYSGSVQATYTIVVPEGLASLGVGSDLGSTLEGGEYVIYSFTAPESCTYAFELAAESESSDFEYAIYVYDPEEGDWDSNWGYGSGTITCRWACTAGQTYYVKVYYYDYNDDGSSASLTTSVSEYVEDTPTLAKAKAKATAVCAGKTYTATISTAGGYAYYKITPSSSTDYTFYTTGDYDTYSYLYDSSWDLLDSDDDDGDGTNTSITYALTAGKTYYLVYRLYSSDDTGSFSVCVDGPTSLSKAKVTLSATSKTYTGKAVKCGIKTVKLDGATLKAGTDYTVSYSKNKAIGTAKVTIKGKGSYSGSVTKTFKIKPAKVTLKSVKAGASGSKKLTVKWATTAAGKKSGAKYQIAYKKKGANKWSYKTVSAKTYTMALTKLAKGKKYTVKVRAYKKVSGKTYYGAWSKTKTVKVK